MSPRARVVGLGQSIAGDDGVGLLVIDALRRQRLAPWVELCVARDASELISLLEGVRLAIVVDAAPDLGTPGSVYAFSPERLEQAAQNTLSSHGVSVGQALALARVIHADPAPEVHVVAIGIERPRRYVSEVSKRVAGAVPEAAAVILELLDQAAHA